MLNWLSTNVSTILICSILIVIVVAILRNMVNNRKHGKSTCGCGCSNCGVSDDCHPKNHS